MRLRCVHIVRVVRKVVSWISALAQPSTHSCVGELLVEGDGNLLSWRGWLRGESSLLSSHEVVLQRDVLVEASRFETVHELSLQEVLLIGRRWHVVATQWG